MPWLAAFACAALACGSDGNGSPFELRIVDRASDSPVAGVDVTSGNARSTSDDSGNATIQASDSVRLEHPQFEPLELTGFGSGAVTVPMRPRNEPTGTVRGSVEGWDALPAPGPGEYLLARIQETSPVHVGDIVEQLLAGSRSDECIRQVDPTPCDYELSVRTRAAGVFVVIASGNDAGTPDDRTDDALRVVEVGFTPVTVDEGASVDAPIRLLPPTAIGRATLQPADAPGSVLAAPVGVPGVSLGDEVLIYPRLPGTITEYVVPVAVEDFGAAILWGIGVVGDETTASVVVQRELSLPAAAGESIDVALPPFPTPPEVTRSGASLEWSGAFELASVSSPAINTEVFVGSAGAATLPGDLAGVELEARTLTGTAEPGDVAGILRGLTSATSRRVP